ncbi:MAG: inorganic diphosphatase [Nitrospiraceae bacterium]|nr:inorganic diphosphatase [Nitrospiraceae bacterium]
MFNPWHDLSLGSNAPHEIQVLIEIPARSRVKYELDKETGLMRVDRILHSAVYYPTNYGLIPQTYCEDNDPLDVFVFSGEPLQSNAIVLVRPVGIIHMEDGGEKDDKIVAVMVKDPEWGQFRHIEDLIPHRIRELTQFLKDYKTLENKQVLVSDVEGNTAAKKSIEDAIALYGSKKSQLVKKAR